MQQRTLEQWLLDVTAQSASASIPFNTNNISATYYYSTNQLPLQAPDKKPYQVLIKKQLKARNIRIFMSLNDLEDAFNFFNLQKYNQLKLTKLVSDINSLIQAQPDNFRLEILNNQYYLKPI